jgi:hypothetical protein
MTGRVAAELERTFIMLKIQTQLTFQLFKDIFLSFCGLESFFMALDLRFDTKIVKKILTLFQLTKKTSFEFWGQS